MNINRNNYEEYFLLYADKELSADEKNMVELFVQQNPDLEEEFVMLQQSVVKPDTAIILNDKNSLFKNSFIDQGNYEEKFLLYTDNELNLDEIEETEKFVLSNPALQNDFTLLQQVKYEPDTSIVFPGKRSLYKKEEDTKVIPFYWKALAAAVLLGIGLWTGISYLQKNKIEPATAVKENIKEPLVKKSEKNENNNFVKKDDRNPSILKPEEKQIDNTVKKPQQNVSVKNILPKDKPELNNVPEQKNEDVAINEPIVEKVKPTNDLPQQINRTAEPNNQTVTKTPVLQNNNYAIPASYIADEEVKSENYVFYNITAEEFKKSKVGNFLKRVKRAIESKIPFKNNSVKIGKVEIAKEEQN